MALAADMQIPANGLQGPDAVAAGAVDDDDALDLSTRWVTDALGRRWRESHLHVSGITCAACAGPIEAMLLATPGVAWATVAASAQRAVVRWDPAQTRLLTIIQSVRAGGYDAVPDGSADQHRTRKREARLAGWRLFVAAFAAMQVMMLLAPTYLAQAPDLTDAMRGLLHWGAWTMTLPVMAFSALPFFAGAWQAIKRARIGMDVPVALGLLVAFLASTVAMVDPQGAVGSAVYFDSLTMFVAFLLAARWLETRLRHRAAESLEETIHRLPVRVLRLAPDGTFNPVPMHRIRVGDHVQVPMGEAFPADGVVVAGSTVADEALLTGEARPVDKPLHAHVVAGSVNVGRAVTVRVGAVGADTRHGAIVALMQDALSQRTPIERVADRWAGPFLWLVLCLAAGSAAVWSVIEPSRAAWVAVSVLIVTCPCALSLAAPSALLAATGHLARRGVLMRRLEAMEVLARVDTVVFDKTGTLTVDEGMALQRADGQPPDDHDMREAWDAVASLAQQSSHPLSKSILQAWARHRAGAAMPALWHDVQEVPGAGLQATDAGGRQWRLGSLAWVEGERSAGEASEPQVGARAWFGQGGVAVWVLSADEVLRDGAAAMMQALRASGTSVQLLSGDAAARVQAVADKLGVVHAMGGATPQEKLLAVQRLQQAGHVVAMVGDGVNDAPVMAQADVCLAMGEGAFVTRQHADGVLLGNHLAGLHHAIALSRRTLHVIRQNLAWAALYNVACVPLAMVGLMPPWAAGLGMALSSLWVVGNAQRLAR